MSTVNFSPTPAEAALVNQIFNLFDTQKLGVLTGDVAIRAFAGAKLAPTVLGEIWNLADMDNKGWLSRKGVSIAIRLMGWAQKGEKVSKELINRPVAVPVIEGVTPLSQQNTGLSLPKSPPPSSFPPLTPQDKTKFQHLFQRHGPQNGLLSGDKARGLFLKSKLANDQLLQIWNLADTQDRGVLDATDFTIGMYFIQAVMSGQLSNIPTSLPPGLYQQAASNPSQAAITMQLTGNNGSFSPTRGSFSPSRVPVVQPQYTGQKALQTEHTSLSAQRVPPNVPTRSATAPFTSSPFAPSTASAHWDVTSSEKANADRFFDELDLHKRGYIEGEIAVPFMLKSNLPGEDLARVWDLADLDNNGRLTRDGFAVAMHLIQNRLQGQELPASLPTSLVPPSLRISNIFGPSPFSVPAQPAQPRQQESVKDLFSFDETPPASALSSQPSASFNILQPQQTGQKYSTPVIQPPVPVTDPFGPSHAHDLLGDDDETSSTPSPPLQDKSAEIGNVQNQLNSTNRTLETTKNERISIEQTLANQASQLAALQTQLSSAKAAYETETKLLATLRDRQANQLAEIQKAREELIRAESDLSAVRVEKAEIEGTFLRDKEEARDLHRKMMEAGQQVEVLKQGFEKVKKEAKQQKGLLAIAKKQLSTKEAERARVEKELEEVQSEVNVITSELHETETALTNISAAVPERGVSPDSVTFAASHPLPSSPPELSNSTPGRSNNPFDKFNLTQGTSTPGSQHSPFLPFAPAPVSTTNGSAQALELAGDTDAFGFDKAFDTDDEAGPAPEDIPAQPQPSTNGAVQTAESTATPKPRPMNLDEASLVQPETVLSAGGETEYFMTPNTSSVVSSSPASSAPQAGKDVSPPQEPVNHEKAVSETSAAAAHFPPIEVFGSQFPVESPDFPGAFPVEQKDQKLNEEHTETDLNAELKEIEEDDSSDESDDEVPLSELAKGKEKAAHSVEEMPISTEKLEPPKVSFDDIFAVTPPTAAETVPAGLTPPPPAAQRHSMFDITTSSSSPFDLPVAANQKPTTGAPAFQPPTSDSGVSAFDEALGIISPSHSEYSTAVKRSTSPPVGGSSFTFDSAFDDDFDFVSASAAASMTLPPASPATAIVPPSTAPVSAQPSQDTSTTDPFGVATAPKPPQQPTTTDTAKPLSFDEVFAGYEYGSNTAASQEFPLASVAKPSTQETPAMNTTTTADTPAQPFPIAGSGSPLDKKGSTASPAGNPLRSASPTPQRAKSPPPPRGSSPKPRLSSSSSKDTPHEKVKETPTRHSKLSIRLPFGKRKKQQQQQQQEAPPPPPPAASHLSTPRELGPIRSISPVGEDDDVQPVKQLISMGFTRAQAVDALERSGYDMQRALNALLGAQ
ncbi:hypothetical protein AMATHDRAFT_70603 [Amanita thiersii Skay4041]|uniref:Actin cytoskeleton-regulatory complex protein PAN1 n=1 Tax=Amanita thiersii Skay4041 TaxID=703135 RepID=A0A2A9N8I4_9AGAR|nr:hypothetical protein AMATHDRAFT_70603 [Amanita thiersii Skay4041]